MSNQKKIDLDGKWENIIELAENISRFDGFHFCYAETLADFLRLVADEELKKADRLADEMIEHNIDNLPSRRKGRG